MTGEMKWRSGGKTWGKDLQDYCFGKVDWDVAVQSICRFSEVWGFLIVVWKGDVSRCTRCFWQRFESRRAFHLDQGLISPFGNYSILISPGPWLDHYGILCYHLEEQVARPEFPWWQDWGLSYTYRWWLMYRVLATFRTPRLNIAAKLLETV